MAYLTYEEYEALSLDPMPEERFLKMEPRAEMKLDAWTFNRIEGMNPVIREVKMVMVELVDGLSELGQVSKSIISGESVTSYSNGVSSWGFDSPHSGDIKTYQNDVEAGLYSMVVEMLPVWLVSRVVEPGCEKTCCECG